MIGLGAFSRVKQLASALGLTSSKVLKDITIKHRKKIYSVQNGFWLEFPTGGDVIVPYSVASAYAKKNKSHRTPLLISQTEIISAARQRLRAASSHTLPVFALLGHFNHGKTSLLDALAGTQYVHKEGNIGITQSIRTKEALSMQLDSGAPITLVDTPGQDIFFRMRNYGASVANAAIIVVSVASGAGFSEPQTAESIGIAESLGIPIVVALNKIDLLSDSSRLLHENENYCEHESEAKSKQSAIAKAQNIVERSLSLMQLQKQGREFTILQDVPFVPISAKTGMNINLLRQVIEEVKENFAPPKGTVQNAETVAAASMITGLGSALDAHTLPGQGLILQTVVQEGVVRSGDTWSSGGWAGQVRTIYPDVIAVGDSFINTECETIRLQELSQARAGQGCRLLVRTFPECADPRPMGNAIIFYSTSKGDSSAKTAALRAADEEAMREMYPNCILSTDEALRLRLPIQELTNSSEAVVFQGDNAEQHNYNQALLVKVSSDAVIGTIWDSWDEMLREIRPHARLVYCAVGNVTRRDISVAQAANATIATMGVSVQSDAMGGKHIKSVILENGDRVDGVSIINVSRVAEVIDMLKNGWK